MPPKVKKTQGKDDGNATLSKANILETIESKMSEEFETRFEDLKDKLITLIAQEVSKLRAKVQNIEQEFEAFKHAQTNNSIAIVEVNERQETLKTSQQKKADVLTKNVTQISDQLSRVQIDIEETKQTFREKNIRLVGLPENETQESSCELRDKINEFSQQHLKISDICKEDIEAVNRMGQKNENKHRDVIVRFKNRDTRNEFYRGRRKLYDPTTKRSTTGVYVNDDLTPYRQRLLFDARNLRKRATIFSVWTFSGTIMVKAEENSIPKPIKTHRELADLIRQSQIEIQDDC